jgi:hypothetical protein
MEDSIPQPVVMGTAAINMKKVRIVTPGFMNLYYKRKHEIVY